MKKIHILSLHLLLIICSLCLLVFTGCQQVPEEVKNHVNTYGDNDEASVIKLNYCTLNDLNNASLNSIRVNNSNVDYPDYVDFSNIININTGTFRFVTNYKENKNYYLNLFDMNGVNGENFSGTLNGDHGIICNDKKNNRCIYLGENGEFSYAGYQFSNGNNIIDYTKDTKKIYLMRGDSVTQDVVLNGNPVALADELNFAQEYLKNIIHDESFDTEIRTIFIKKDNQNNDILTFNAQYEYKGMILDFFGGRIRGDEDGNSIVDEMDDYINIVMTKKDEIAFMNTNGILEKEELSPVDKIIDFQTAVNIFENKMSTFNDLKVVEIEPVYMLEPVYDNANDEYYAAPGNKVNITPVYSFLLECGDDNIEDIGLIEGNGLAYVNVNMITGEVTTNFEEKRFALENDGDN